MRYEIVRTLARCGAVGLLLSALATASRAGAQTPTVILQHGFFGDEHTWEQAQPQIALQISAQWIRPRTGWYLPLDSQSTNLFQFFFSGNPHSTAFVAHSFGGLLGRYTLQQGHPWKAVVTFGTPHGGTPIAQSVVNGNVARWLSQLQVDVLSPFEFFQSYVSFLEALELQDYEWVAADALSNYAVAGVLGNAMGLLDKVRPGTPFMEGVGGLNGTQGLLAEASAAPTRKPFTSVHTLLPDQFPGDHESGLLCRVSTGGLFWTQVCFGTQIALASYMGYKYLQYSNASPWDDPLNYQVIQSNAIRWATGAWDVWHLDHSWCGLIGAVSGGNCGLSDGLIPATSSNWPGSPPPTVVGNIGHTEQPSRSEVAAKVIESLQSAGYNNGSALSVSAIQGPTLVDAYSSATFSVSATGSGTLTYLWSVNGTVQGGTGSQFTWANTGANFTISVQVGNGASSVNRSLAVQVQTCGAIYC